MLEIKALDEFTFPDLERCDGSFLVDARLVLSLENGAIRWTYSTVPPYTRRYPPEEIDYRSYLNDPDKAVYLATLDGRAAGQVRLSCAWNRFAWVEDLVVDAGCRKQCVGRALLEQAAQWARLKNLAGIRLETQNTNPGACRFYQRCGFILGGFDRFLYRATLPGTEDTALYWYLIF